LSSDIYAQWKKWKRHGNAVYLTDSRCTGIFQALKELKAEGGIEARYRRYCRNHEVLVEGMRAIGFSPCWNRKS